MNNEALTSKLDDQLLELHLSIQTEITNAIQYVTNLFKDIMKLESCQHPSCYLFHLTSRRPFYKIMIIPCVYNYYTRFTKL